ncbi:BrnA antitoxin family protein [Chlorobium sp. KB01]|uniref:BrnA antitoxin family protein n=1 Tax=Chlorobium sp. KB01 TaxID=1917528 RepID=UPI00097824C6|nr:BrnA antitoxin family protein [Chlorobium sp. KB01]
MKKSDRIVRYTDKELLAMQERGEDKSNWEEAAALTDDEIEAAIAGDPDEGDMVVDWSSATVELPQPKAVLNMRVDYEVLEYFRNQGKGYQTKINAVLRSYVDHRQQKEKN